MADTSAAAGNLAELSVSELALSIKRTMETAFDRVRVRGELGRVTIAKSGHLYADLKDENAVVRLVMWKGVASQLKFRPEEGLEVVVEGKITTFPGKSEYQIVADRMEPAGAGALLAQLEKLKARLAAEGLFASDRKKPIPFLPSVIGVVTSPTGAVIRDILHRLEERFPRRVILWPVQVQGAEAAGQIARAIHGFNVLEGDMRPDLLIVARGGGSIEDLWAFNEEIVVRAAAQSRIPLISAVGHETDTTLIDFASDKRAPTPTAAAEMAVPVRAELAGRIETLAGRLASGLSKRLNLAQSELKTASVRLGRPDALVIPAAQRLDRAGERLDIALAAAARVFQGRFDRIAGRVRSDMLAREVRRKGESLTQMSARMVARAPGMQVPRLAQSLVQAHERLQAAFRRAVQDRARRLAHAGTLIEALSHQRVLDRGFALVRDASGGLVRSSRGLEAGQTLSLLFADGAIGVQVLDEAPARKPGQNPAKAPQSGDNPDRDAKRKPKETPKDQGSLF